jgi:hypothetical protein
VGEVEAGGEGESAEFERRRVGVREFEPYESFVLTRSIDGRVAE